MSRYAEGMESDATAEGASEELPLGVMPLSPSLVCEELGSAIRLLQKHQRRMQEIAEGVLSSEEKLSAIVVEAVGELLYTSSKLESLARVINGESAGG